MFAINDILISDTVLEAPFACDLGRCHGACCVQGDSGAPLAPDERAQLEAVLPAVRRYLTPEALAVVEERGLWEDLGREDYATTCVESNGQVGPCVFVTYEGPVAKCAIQKAFYAGEVDWPKPISCHLFPIRVNKYGDQEVLNYEQLSICRPGRTKGCRSDIQLYDFLKEPLVRNYGQAWYQAFRAACIERKEVLEEGQRRSTPLENQ